MRWLGAVLLRSRAKQRCSLFYSTLRCPGSQAEWHPLQQSIWQCPRSQAECCSLQPQLLRGWKQKENLKLHVQEQPGQDREAPTETRKYGNKCQNAVPQKVIASTKRLTKREENTPLLYRQHESARRLSWWRHLIPNLTIQVHRSGETWFPQVISWPQVCMCPPQHTHIQ